MLMFDRRSVKEIHRRKSSAESNAILVAHKCFSAPRLTNITLVLNRNYATMRCEIPLLETMLHLSLRSNVQEAFKSDEASFLAMIN